MRWKKNGSYIGRVENYLIAKCPRHTENKRYVKPYAVLHVIWIWIWIYVSYRQLELSPTLEINVFLADALLHFPRIPFNIELVHTYTHDKNVVILHFFGFGNGNVLCRLAGRYKSSSTIFFDATAVDCIESGYFINEIKLRKCTGHANGYGEYIGKKY